MTELHWSHSVHHDGSSCYVVANETISLGSTVKLRVRTGLDAPVKSIFVRTNPDGEQHMTSLRLSAKGLAACWWEGDIPIRMVKTNYRFFLLTDEGNWWLTAAGMMRYTPADTTDFRILAHYHAPTWVRDSVFYQIFPERFADGDPSNCLAATIPHAFKRLSAKTRRWRASPPRCFLPSQAHPASTTATR